MFDFDGLDEIEEAGSCVSDVGKVTESRTDVANLASSTFREDDTFSAKPLETKQEASCGTDGVDVKAESPDLASSTSEHFEVTDLAKPTETIFKTSGCPEVAESTNSAPPSDGEAAAMSEKPAKTEMEPADASSELPVAASDSPETLPSFWRVCGGSNTGGIVVRCEEDLSSSIIGRLQGHAVVEELERSGDRVRYLRVFGEGPLTGWVSARTATKELLEAVASDWRPPSKPPSLPLSPADEAVTARGDQQPPEAASKHSNLIFLDWDDTLCPTSWIEQRPELKAAVSGKRTGQLWYLLGEQAQAVAKLVRTALSLGPVVLVTLAQRPWVKVSIKDFMPQVGDEVVNLDVFYARENLGRPAVPGNCPWTAMKRRAMQAALTEFEKKGSNTWENLISIGDSEVEKRAAKDLGRELQSSNQIKWTKTVKLTERPSVTQLTSQVRALNERLSELVNHQGDKHVDAKEWLKPR